MPDRCVVERDVQHFTQRCVDSWWLVQHVSMVRQQLGELDVPAMAQFKRVTKDGSGDRYRFQITSLLVEDDVRHAGQGDGRHADPTGTGEEPRDGLDRNDLGPPLVKELAKRVVEPEVRQMHGSTRRRGVDTSDGQCEPIHCIGEIPRGGIERIRKGPPKCCGAPRGQNSRPTTTLTAQPIVTSSILVSPTRHPAGAMMLNKMTTTTVKPACPAAKEIIDGAVPATSTATGRSNHSTTRCPATAIMITDPMTNPTAVPATARTAVDPVPSALDRNTDSVPRTTQNPCSTLVTSTIATASVSPAAPRTAFRNHTERNERSE